VVGWSTSGEDHIRAFRWDGTLRPLPALPGAEQSRAYGASADGSIIVGVSGLGAAKQANRAVRWQNDTITNLGLLPGGDADPISSTSAAAAVSADGSVIVGTAKLPGASEVAVRWVNGVIDSLTVGGAAAVTSDGKVIVGYGLASVGVSEPFLWNEEDGAREIRTILMDDFAIDIGTWQLGTPTGISDDGRVVVGTGRNPDGKTQGWRIVLGPDTDLIVTVPTDEPNDPASAAEDACDIDRSASGNQCTLRAAITLANTREGEPLIRFRLPDNEQVITIETALPALKWPTTLAGTLSSEGVPTARIHGGARAFDGLVFTGGASRIEALSITGFKGAAVVFRGTGGHIVDRCRIGVGLEGNDAFANGAGVLIEAPMTIVQGSLVSGNSWPAMTSGVGSVTDARMGTGVWVNGVTASNTTIKDSNFGVTADSTMALRNRVSIVGLGAPDLIVENNTILGLDVGVHLLGSTPTAPIRGTKVEGNRIGLLPNGRTAPGTSVGVVGVLIDGAENVVIGGAAVTPGEAPGNVIGSVNTGIRIRGTNDVQAVGTRIVGNLVGLDPMGMSPRPGVAGVWVLGRAQDTQIGGWEPGDRNVIAAYETGIALTNGNGDDTEGESSGTLIAGNYIGTDIMGLEEIDGQTLGIYAGPVGLIQPGATEQGGVSGAMIGAPESIAPGAPLDLRRNVIAGSDEAHILLNRTGNPPSVPTEILDNWIGLTADGAGGATSSTLGSATKVGVWVEGTARAQVGRAGSGNVIGGSVIGVRIDGDESTVVGNRIGTDAAGVEARANLIGVAVSGSRVQVGVQGESEAVPNVISGNSIARGAALVSHDGVGVLVAAPYVIDEFATLGGASTVVQPSLEAEIQALHNAMATFPPSTAVEREGRRAGSERVEDVTVAHNLIGLTASGDAPVVATDDLPVSYGVFIAPGARQTRLFANTISGNDTGVRIDLHLSGQVERDIGLAPTGILVAANRIGLPLAGPTPEFVPNRRIGLMIFLAESSTIGDGAVDGQGPNKIAGTGTEGSTWPPTTRGAPGILALGVDLAGPLLGEGNTFRRNLIWGNEGIAITHDIETLGVTPNRPENTDGTASFNVPRLLQATGDDTALFVQGTSTPPMVVEVYADRPCDASGYGEGRVYLGTVQAMNGVFEGTVNPAPFGNWRISVTGTNVNGSTSEFSRCQPIAAAADVAMLDVAPGQTLSLDGPDITLSVTDNPTRSAAKTRRAAMGTLFAALHRSSADEGLFDGSATSDDGTLVTPDDVQRQRFWTVQADSLDGITYGACLRYDELFSLPVPEQLVVVTRATRGEAWTPHASTLRTEGDESFLCANGLTAFGEFAIGADGAVNPVPNDPGPDDEPLVPEALALLAFPNPASGAMTVEVAMPEAGTARVSVHDALGREVAMLHDGPLAAGLHAFPLGTAGLPPGLYHVILTTPGSTVMRRVTVVR